jgi:hypothetical protein
MNTYGGYFGKLKVYVWVEQGGEGFEAAFPEYTKSHNRQVRMIVAACSKAEAARCAGYKYPSQMWNLFESGNVIDAGVSLNEPCIVFWRPLGGHNLPYRRKEQR